MNATCTRCHRHRRIKSLGECGTCYTRRYEPRTGNPGARGVLKSREVRAGRLEDVAELLAWGEDQRMIATRLGLSVRTIYRYLARLEAAS
jgi:DNA invertase Pin-like site-specific DNA recombinase